MVEFKFHTLNIIYQWTFIHELILVSHKEYGGDQGSDEPPPSDQIGAESGVRVSPSPAAVDVPAFCPPE